eukprot:451686-Prymnesium_polylepis.1
MLRPRPWSACNTSAVRGRVACGCGCSPRSVSRYSLYVNSGTSKFGSVDRSREMWSWSGGGGTQRVPMYLTIVSPTFVSISRHISPHPAIRVRVARSATGDAFPPPRKAVGEALSIGRTTAQ